MPNCARFRICFEVLFCALGALLPAAHAQNRAGPAPANHGQLAQFANMDAHDAAARLEVLEQAVYDEQQQITTLLFLDQYRDRIHLEQVLYPDAEGHLIPGYVFSGTSLDRRKRNPALVMVYGGFHGTLDWHFFPLIADAVSRGYVVIFPEYRGSRGYGAQLYKNDYGVSDVEDVLAAATYISERAYVDPGRLGIVGHSRGGMIALLALEKSPSTFKAAVDIAGMADFLMYMAYKPDYRRNQIAQEPHFHGQLPSENLEAYRDVSPVNYVEKIETPLLLLGTTKDDEVPWSLNSGRVIDALKARNKVFDYHVYEKAPGSHVFLWGDTAEARDCYKRTFDWLDKYLK